MPSHLHLNVTYLLEADEAEVLKVKPDENSGVKWFSLEGAIEACSEPWMIERIYKKLNAKLETIDDISILAKLEMNSEEKAQAKQNMEKMLASIEKLQSLDTTNVEPMAHIFPVSNVFREDIVQEKDGSTDTLANAPEQKDGGIKVPRTIA